jgi:hypothetical protein
MIDNNSTVIIDNCAFNGTYGFGYGVGSMAGNSIVTVTNTNLTYVEATECAGFLVTGGSQFSARNLYCADSSAEYDTACVCAILNATVSIHDSVFERNRGWVLFGASVRLYDRVDATITNSVFRDHTLSQNAPISAQLSNLSNKVTVANCSFTNNVAASGDNFLLLLQGGTMHVNDTTFTDNVGVRSIYALNNYNLYITGSTFSNNTATSVLLAGATNSVALVQNSTFTRNRAAGEGGGSWNITTYMSY